MVRTVHVFVVAMCLYLTACGGGGGSATSVTSVKQSQIGSYSLLQSTEQISRTLVPFAAYSSSTFTPADGYNGSLSLGNTLWKETATYNNQTSSISGNYNFFIDVPEMSGTFSLSVTGSCYYNGTYNILDNRTIQVTYNPLLIDGQYVKLIDTWQKVSDAP